MNFKSGYPRSRNRIRLFVLFMFQALLEFMWVLAKLLSSCLC